MSARRHRGPRSAPSRWEYRVVIDYEARYKIVDVCVDASGRVAHAWVDKVWAPGGDTAEEMFMDLAAMVTAMGKPWFMMRDDQLVTCELGAPPKVKKRGHRRKRASR